MSISLFFCVVDKSFTPIDESVSAIAIAIVIPGYLAVIYPFLFKSFLLFLSKYLPKLQK